MAGLNKYVLGGCVTELSAWWVTLHRDRNPHTSITICLLNSLNSRRTYSMWWRKNTMNPLSREDWKGSAVFQINLMSVSERIGQVGKWILTVNRVVYYSSSGQSANWWASTNPPLIHMSADSLESSKDTGIIQWFLQSEMMAVCERLRATTEWGLSRRITECMMMFLWPLREEHPLWRQRGAEQKPSLKWKTLRTFSASTPSLIFYACDFKITLLCNAILLYFI